MAKMMKPEVEITRFGGGIDVIATSGNPGFTLTGVGDGDPDNFNLNFKGTNYSQDKRVDFMAALEKQYGDYYEDYRLSWGDMSATLGVVFNWDESAPLDGNAINGTYVWYDNTEYPNELWFKKS